MGVRGSLAAPGGCDPSRDRAARLTHRDAHRRRKVALLPGTAADHRTDRHRHLTADCAHEGSGRRPAPDGLSGRSAAQWSGRQRTAGGERTHGRGRHSPALYVARADRQSRVAGVALPGRCLFVRHRRGPLHQPVGAPVSTGIPAVGVPARALPRGQLPRIHRHSHTARSRRRGRPTRATQPADHCRIGRPAQSRLPDPTQEQPQRTGARDHSAPSRRGRDRLLPVAQGDRKNRRGTDPPESTCCGLPRRHDQPEANRRPGSASTEKRSTWSWRRSRLGWGSTAATYAA